MIEWSETRRPNSECSYTHVVAMTPFGKIQIEWKGWKERPSYDATTPWGYENLYAESLDEAKSDIEILWKAKLAECIV